MTRIIHVITRMIRGGADENTLLSCNAQAEAGHEVHLIYGDEVSQAMLERLHPAVIALQVPIMVRRLSPYHDTAALWALWGYYRKVRPDIVHTHTSKAGIIGRAAAVAAGVPGIVHGVHILPFLNVGKVQKLVYLAAEKAVAPFTHAFVNVSEGMQVEGLRYGVGRPDRHSVVPSGMDIQVFAEAEPVTDVELSDAGVPAVDGERFVVMVAALERRKKIWEFLELFRDVLAAEPNTRFLVLGEGNDRDRIHSRAKELGVEDRVHLLGFRADVHRWIKRADVCVLASEREGLPRSVIQYALAARPIVSTNLPGIETVVRHGETGFLVPVDDLNQMVHPIVTLLRDSVLSLRFSNNAANADLRPWGLERMVASLSTIYGAVLSNARS